MGISDMLISQDEGEQDDADDKNVQDEAEAELSEKEIPHAEVGNATCLIQTRTTEEKKNVLGAKTDHEPERENEGLSQVREDEVVAVQLQTQPDREIQEESLQQEARKLQRPEREQALHAQEDNTADHGPLAQTQVSKEALYHEAFDVETQDLRTSKLGHVRQSKEG